MGLNHSKIFNEAQEFQQSKERLSERLDSVTERYLIGEQIGEGAMKKIYCAHDAMTGRDVAMAVLKDTENETMVEAFLREAQICSWLEHPGIIPVYDVGINDEGFIMVGICT